MKNRILNLFQANKDRGSFKAEAGADGNVIELYDVIVSSEAEAAWYGGVSLQAFAKALGGMSGDVHLRINSPGGDVFAGIAMAQLMREYKGDITAHVDGYAASAASLIAVAAKKCVMAPGSMMMIHKAWTFAIGNADELLETADLLDKIDGQLAETYAAKTGKKAAEFTAMMAKDTWFTPQEAKDAGLCDEIASKAGGVSAAARNTLWDMSVFENAPKPAAPSQTESEKAAAALAAAAEVTAAENAAAESERQQRVLALQALLVTAA